ncbi:ABATE domain-containing protein [Paenibacillus sp. MWE-103]|uniref:ABATE domain-containing protein n=1 Tax=Paenibacillus artemisiicola TaxID=1172618 RepID=A0ABS3W350_9BACL|nr:ABATE domain-containing protein [Paenibacillus artemisiicola]MBO7742722.1 ABATE domain-containing protein [Paenibacillus artemisiicola]
MLWDDFLNSLHHDWRGDGAIDDRLDRADWLAGWLGGYGLSAPVPPSAEELRALKRMRDELHGMAAGFAAGAAPSEADLATLNAYMAASAVVRRLTASEDGGLRIGHIPAGDGWTAAQAEIAASMARMIAAGDPSRVRICQNPSCLWVYYDETRNRSKRYCDDKMCGNLLKVRRFRAKRKAPDAPAE